MVRVHAWVSPKTLKEYCDYSSTVPLCAEKYSPVHEDETCPVNCLPSPRVEGEWG